MTVSPSAGARTWTPTGSPSSPVPKGTLIGRVAGQVGRDRAHVAQIHGERIGGLGAEREGGGRRRRGQQDVEALVGRLEVSDDQGANLLRFAVVGVVVARRQGVRPEHDASLHLGAETLRTRAQVHLGDVGRSIHHPQAVPDAVVAGQVRRRLGRGDQVVGREAVHGGRHVDLLHLGPRRGQCVGGLPGARHHVGGDPLGADQFRDDADPQTVHAFTQTSGSRWRHTRKRCGVGRVGAGDHVEQQGGVGHVGRQRPDLIERAGEGDQPEARDQAVGRLGSDHAAERGGLTDGAAGVRAQAERRRSRPTRRRRCPPTTRPGPGAGPEDCGWARRPSSPSRIPWRTRRGWSCRRSPRPPPPGAARPWRRRGAASHPGSGTSRSSAHPWCTGCPSAPRAPPPVARGHGRRRPLRLPGWPWPGPTPR